MVHLSILSYFEDNRRNQAQESFVSSVDLDLGIFAFNKSISKVFEIFKNVSQPTERHMDGWMEKPTDRQI